MPTPTTPETNVASRLALNDNLNFISRVKTAVCIKFSAPTIKVNDNTCKTLTKDGSL